MPLFSVYVFLQQNLGWFLLGAVIIAAIGAVSLAWPRARENGISNRIFVTAAIVAVGTLVAYACGILASSLVMSPS